MAKQPSYKLYYFNCKVLAEPIRILFAYGGIQYEDVRFVYMSDEWLAAKSSMPMGQMPVLEIDGKRIHQSVAIARYVAKLVGLAGSNDWENLQIDIIVDTVNEFRAKLATVGMESDENIKQQKFEDLKTNVIPFYVDKFEAIAKENNGYLVLSRLTWADVFFAGILDYLKFVAGFDFTENHSNLQQVITNVSNVESIKAWIEKRPKTDL